MNRIFKIFSILTLGVLFTACPKDDAPEPVPARPHADVYPEDLIKIEDYLKSHYVEITDEDLDGEVDVADMKIDSLDDTHTVSIWDQTEYPLENKIVKLYGVDFKVYYLKFDGKADTDAEGDKPCGTDRVLVSYRGSLLDGYQFDYAPNPVEFNLIDVVKGWEYIMPQFRAGYFDPVGGDGTLNPRNFGSGVMFLPSGLGYYSGGFGNIPAYAPLVFTFNLFAVTRLDQDIDKIEDRYEYEFNEDGSLIDTDADGIPNVFDNDDDGDGYKTINEIKHTYVDNGVTYTVYYPFTGAAVDNPATPFVDETQGIPRCFTGPNSTESPFLPTSVPADFTEPTRLRRHLDRNCKPPFGG
ncbi:hypothetical protein FLJC2902T_23870 [Flavobacterium limnosediminis JC2902]|uniref:peptidylprolyl isomerase n=1 Tax=Flavobacterium limnosediminis JC2902 TaxID=1341181 RepID=V6SRJ4_9FLAO|nr:hypothetical protein [Flavobacterium limnosediminis]ESU27045.1 hypothetical protein FLJC2902T_23870 [Flavobacterium limnosediminis JC2902]